MPTDPTGVIHDLGYRHYDGPRLGRGHIARALFLDSAKGAYGLGRPGRSKIMPMILLAAMCLPALIIAVVASLTNQNTLPLHYTAYGFAVQALVMVYVASQAPVSVSRDLRFQVMPLYFSRPLLRMDYVLAKFAALAAAVLVLLALPLTILLAGALLGKMPVTDQLPNYLTALAGAVVTALLLAGISLLIAALTPRRGLGIAAIIAVLALLVGVQGALTGIAVEQHQDDFAGYAGLVSPFTLVDGLQHALLNAPSDLRGHPPGALGAVLFVVTAVAVLAGCLGALVLRYRKVTI